MNHSGLSSEVDSGLNLLRGYELNIWLRVLLDKGQFPTRPARTAVRSRGSSVPCLCASPGAAVSD